MFLLNYTLDVRVILLLSLSYSIWKTASGKAVLSDEVRRPSRALFASFPDRDLQGAPWRSSAQEHIRKILEREPDTRQAKNVVMFLGDGMSVATVSAARVLHGQKLGMAGEESKLSFEEFPYTGLSKTYCVDKQVADSACSATAYLGGVKANLGTIGVTAAVKRGDCPASAVKENHVHSIAVWAQRAGKSTGIVTTTRITHASPAGTYAHIADRDWEADSNVIKSGADINVCKDIAHQLIRTAPGMNHKVILGGGRKNFYPNTTKDAEGNLGVRFDNRNLVNEWLKDKHARGTSASYVMDRSGLMDAADDAEYLLGLFDPDHMQYHLDADPETEPTLAEMTEAAIKVLSKDDNGFFLFVEGGRIDQAHHDNLAHKALDETLQFSDAVKLAVEQLSDDTLIVITADHAHTMSYSGYAQRGNNILGFGGKGTDNLPYLTLSYANGPSYKPEVGGRYNLTNDNYNHPNYTFPSPVPLDSETHGGEDVEVFAQGPWSHLFTGAYEQNVIPHIMAYAACIGPGLTACDDGSYKNHDNHNGKFNINLK